MSRLSRLSWKTLPVAALLAGLLPLASAQAFPSASKPVPKNPVALFTFDTLSDGKDPAFHQTVHGLTGTFAAPGGDVLHVDGKMPGFSGNYLFLPQGDLTLTFDKPLTELSLDFVDTSAFHPTILTLSDGNDSVFGTGQRFAGLGETWLSAGALDLKGSSPFTQITLHSSNHLPFAVDDVKADVAPVPEASTLISFGALLVVGSLVLFVRRRKARA
jgi:hypothetical protein